MQITTVPNSLKLRRFSAMVFTMFSRKTIPGDPNCSKLSTPYMIRLSGGSACSSFRTVRRYKIV